MKKKNKEPELLTDQEPEKKRGLLRLIELVDRDGGKFFKAGLLALPGVALLFAAVQVALANANPVLLLVCIPIGMLTAPAMAGTADTVTAMSSIQNSPEASLRVLRSYRQ